MNDIGIGIMCFGADKYFEHTQMLIDSLQGIDTYVLTDNPCRFPESQNTFKYNRTIKSYHDKVILAKEILKSRDLCIILDADTLIKDTSIVHDLLNYEFQEGITYIDYLSMVPYYSIGDIEPTERWLHYLDWLKITYPEYYHLETIHEYFMVFKRDIRNDFFVKYEKLQIIKEYCDVLCGKGIIGAGEGVSIHVAAKMTDTPIRKDDELNKIIRDKILNITQSR